MAHRSPAMALSFPLVDAQMPVAASVEVVAADAAAAAPAPQPVSLEAHAVYASGHAKDLRLRAKVLLLRLLRQLDTSAAYLSRRHCSDADH